MEKKLHPLSNVNYDRQVSYAEGVGRRKRTIKKGETGKRKTLPYRQKKSANGNSHQGGEEE